MHTFANSAWTEADTQPEARATRQSHWWRVERDLEACIYLCSSDLSGRPPRESYVIQRELAREEIRKRAAGTSVV